MAGLGQHTRRMTGSKTDPNRRLADIVSPTYLYLVSGSSQLDRTDQVRSIRTVLLTSNSPEFTEYWYLRVLPCKKGSTH